MSFISDIAGRGVYNVLFSAIVSPSESVTGTNMTETLLGILMPSGFTTVNSPTCTAFPMPSGNGTAPLDASAAGSLTPVVMPGADATQLSSGHSLLQPAGYSRSGTSTGCGVALEFFAPETFPDGRLFLMLNARAERVTPCARLEMLQCDLALRAGYT